MPLMTFPVPLQSGQFLASIRPLPRQRGHRFSPVPDVPGDASSPGFAGSDLGPHRPHAGCWALRRRYRAPGSRSVRRARRAVVPLAYANRPPRRRCRRLHVACEHPCNDACQDITGAGGGAPARHRRRRRATVHRSGTRSSSARVSSSRRKRASRRPTELPPEDSHQPRFCRCPGTHHVVGMRRDHRAIDPRPTARRGRQTPASSTSADEVRAGGSAVTSASAVSPALSPGAIRRGLQCCTKACRRAAAQAGSIPPSNVAASSFASPECCRRGKCGTTRRYSSR